MKFLSVLLPALLAVGAHGTCSSSPPTDYDFNIASGKYYKRHTTKKNFYEARNACEQENERAMLAVIKTEEDFVAVKPLAGNNNEHDCIYCTYSYKLYGTFI